MIIPDKITIQIIDKAGNPNPFQNVLFGFNVFVTEDHWHNYSPLKSDSMGQVTITREEIVNDIIYQSLIQDEKLLSPSPTYFELHVWEGQFTVDLIQGVNHVLQTYSDENAIKGFLKEKKILEANIPVALEIIKNKAAEDKGFYERIKDAVNNSIIVENSKIRGIWEDSLPKRYEFVFQPIEN